MEFSNVTPRADLANVTATPSLRMPPGALSISPETTRPVTAAEATNKTAASKDDGFQPLDTYEVGDNDRLPVPPEPPREAMVLAIMAAAPVEEAVDIPADARAEPEAEPAKAPERATALAETLRDIDAGPANPTVDIRR